MKRFFSLMLATGTILSCGSKIQHPVKVFKTNSGKELKIMMINHGSLAIEYGNLQFQIDPVSSYGGKDVDYTIFPDADYILVTHEHGDHLCSETIDMIRGPKTRIFINEAGQEKLGAGEVMKNGESIELQEGITLTAVPAYNISEGHTQFHPKGNGNGYILSIDGLRIYISGDSENISEMSGLGKIDIAFLAANQPYTMTEEQCIEAALRIHPEYLIPYHLSDTDAWKIKDALQEHEIKVLLYEELK